MKPRSTSLRASLGQLAEEFVDGVLRALRGASFAQMGDLRSPAAHPPPGVQVSRPSEHATRLLAKLSRREREIFERILHGSSNDKMARDLGLSVKTVQTHRAKVNKKLGVRSGSELVRFGATHGLLNMRRHGGVASPGRGDTEAAAPVFDLAEVERRTIAAALRAADGDRNRAAALLGIPRSKLDTKVGPAELALGRRSRKDVASPASSGAEGAAHAGARVAGAKRGRRSQRSMPARSTRDADPRVVITDPGGLLGALAESQTLDDVPAEEPVAATAASGPRPAARAGEDVLRGAGGGLVFRRRRAGTPADRS